MEKFILGLAVGVAGGALVVANNCKLRNLVKKNQEDILSKAETYIDQKLAQFGADPRQSSGQSEQAGQSNQAVSDEQSSSETATQENQ